MRVLIAHSWYLSGSVSGENRVVEDQAALLRDGGHEVRVWAPSAEQVSTAQAGLGTVWSRSASKTMRRLTVDFKPDVVHVHNLFPMLSPAVLRAVGPCPIVMTLHNYRYMCLPGTLFRNGAVCEDCLDRIPWRGVVHRCYRDSVAGSAALATSLTAHRAIGSFARVDLFLAVSAWMKRKHEEAGLPGARVEVQTNFAHPTEVRRGPGRYFLYAGRLAPEKGVDMLVGSWHEELAPLVVVGDGPEIDRLRAMATPNVEFRGAMAGAAMPGVLRDARALVVPSRWYEGAPRSIIEAYAASVPAIVSRIGSLPENVHDGVSGVLLPPEDAAAWIAAAERLMNDAESERLGRGAHAVWQETHTPEHALKRLESAYARVIRSMRVGTQTSGKGPQA